MLMTRLPAAAAVLGTLAAGAFSLHPSGTADIADAADDAPMTVYFGTTHVHTGAHNDHGEDDSGAGQVFQTAKENGFDFVMLTEHSGPTGPKDPEGFYERAQAKAKEATEEGVFVALAGYEYSENNGDGDSDSGHVTGYGTQRFVDASDAGMRYTDFWEYLGAQSETRDVFAGFNHPPAEGHDGAIDPAVAPGRRVVALSETSNGVAYDVEEEAAYYQAFVRALDRGWRVAPTCGLDSHGLYGLTVQESDAKEPCRAGVLLQTLGADELVAAIIDRRVYSTRDTNLRAKYRASGAWMGSRIEATATVDFDIVVKDSDVEDKGDEIRRIEIVGEHGRVVAAETFADHTVKWSPTVQADGNSYLFVRVFTREHSAHTAVLAPVWLR
jgi:hypothetical protein